MKDRIGNQEAQFSESVGVDAKKVVILTPDLGLLFLLVQYFQGNRIGRYLVLRIDLLPYPDQVGLNRSKILCRNVEHNTIAPKKCKFPDVQAGIPQQIFQQIPFGQVEQDNSPIFPSVDYRKGIDETLFGPIDSHDHAGRYTNGGEQLLGIQALPGPVVIQILPPLPVLALYIRVGGAEVDLLTFGAEETNKLNVGQLIE